MKKYYTAEGIDKTLMLSIMGSEVQNRVWCVGVKKDDTTYRVREIDGFYDINILQPIN
jgi:hypothetical protein